MFRSANTIVRSPLQTVRNKAKYGVIIFAICEPTCVTTVSKM